MSFWVRPQNSVQRTGLGDGLEFEKRQPITKVK